MNPTVSFTSLIFLSLIISFSSHAKVKGEFGAGMEYGLLGTQLYLPSLNDKLEAYVSFGIVGLSSNSDTQTEVQKVLNVLSGVGINYRASGNSKWGVYGGYMGNETTLEGKNENYYGLGLGYKHRLPFISRKLYVGASYNFNKVENFFSASVSYQFDW